MCNVDLYIIQVRNPGFSQEGAYIVIHFVTVPIIEAPTEVIVEDVDGEKVEGEEEVQDGTASRASKIDDVGSVHKEEDPTTEVTTSVSLACLPCHSCSFAFHNGNHDNKCRCKYILFSIAD